MGKSKPEVRKGTAMFNVLVLILIVSIMALGASLLVPHEAISTRQRVESEQALYLAEAGLEYGKAYLEGKFPDLPGTYTESRALTPGTFTATVVPQATASPWSVEYQITSMGASGRETRVLRSIERIGAFSDYVYITDYERPDDTDRTIWFATQDTITGPLHTNDQIHIMGDPTFTAHVSSAWGGPDDSDPSHSAAFMYYNGGSSHIESAAASNPPHDYPTFAEGYNLGTERIELPVDLVDMQDLAMNAGLYINQQCQIEMGRDDGGTPMYGYVSYRLKSGEAWGEWTDVEISSMSAPVVYIHNKIEISGILDGELTIVSADHMEISDDIVYRDAVNGIPNDGCDDMLGLISGGDILILDNAANSDGVIIDASIMAIDGSFRVESYNQNGYRGVLRIVGGVIQKYRGPVGIGYVDEFGRVLMSHGYNKDYRFDMRFYDSAPPYFFSTGEYKRIAWIEMPSTG
jgi:hypothetical protein